MLQPLNFSYKDFGSIMRKAFSLKKMLSMAFFLFLAFVSLNLFSWLVVYLTRDLHQIDWVDILWKDRGLVPFLFDQVLPWYGSVIYYIGIILSYIFVMLGLQAVVKITFQELKGDFFFSTFDAIKYSFKNIAKVVAPQLLILFLIFLIVIGGLIESLIFKIPYFGELFNSFMMIVIIPFSIILFFVIIVFGVSLLFVHSIAGTVEDDFFEVVYQIFSTVTSQPLRLIIYSFYTIVQAVIGLFIWSFVLYKSFKIFEFIFSLLAKDKIFPIINNAYYYITNLFPQWKMIYYNDILGTFSFICTPSHQKFIPVNWSMTVASVVMAIVIFKLLLISISYFFSILAVGDTITYLIIRYKKDDEDLVKLSDEDDMVDLEAELKEYEVTDGGDDSNSETNEEDKN